MVEQCLCVCVCVRVCVYSGNDEGGIRKKTVERKRGREGERERNYTDTQPVPRRGDHSCFIAP